MREGIGGVGGNKGRRTDEAEGHERTERLSKGGRERE